MTGAMLLTDYRFCRFLMHIKKNSPLLETGNGPSVQRDATVQFYPEAYAARHEIPADH